jgi:CheY-like chemotaxis protein
VEEYQFLFQPCRSEDGAFRVGLSSVASLIGSLGGEYGFRPRSIGPDGSILTDNHGQRLEGSIFWFSIPLLTAESSSAPALMQQLEGSMRGTSLGNPNYQGGMMNPLPGMSVGASFNTGMACATENCDDTIANLAASHPNLGDSLSQFDFEPLPVQGVRRRRALIIDDSVVVRKSLERALQKFGFAVSHADTGAIGIQAMQQCMFDLVLCEFLMPSMNGLEYVLLVCYRLFILV